MTCENLHSFFQKIISVSHYFGGIEAGHIFCEMEPTVGLGLAAAGVGTFAVYKVQVCNKFISYKFVWYMFAMVLD